MATSIETTDIEIRVTIGIDTHAEVHVAVALDQLGRRLGAIEIPTTTAPDLRALPALLKSWT